MIDPRGSSPRERMLLYVPTAIPGRVALERVPAGWRPSFALRFVAMQNADGSVGRDAPYDAPYVTCEVPVAATWSRKFALGVLAFALAAATGALLPSATHSRIYAFVAVAFALAGLALVAMVRFEPICPDAFSLAGAILKLRSTPRTDQADAQTPTDAEVEAALWSLAKQDQRLGIGSGTDLGPPVLHRVLAALEGRYRAALRAERHLTLLSIVGCIILALGGTLLVVFVSSRPFWTTFGRIATILAGLAFLLALPALSLAYRTERIVEERLPDEEDLEIVERPDEHGPKATVRSGTQDVLLEDSPRHQGAVIDALRSWLLISGEDSEIDRSAVEGALSRHALESAIAASAGLRVVRKLLAGTSIYALGEPAGDTSVPGQSTESDLLHFTIDEDGDELVMLPVFTNGEVLRDALIRNEDWQRLKVLEIDGGELLKARDRDVALVINPWSETTELQVPPRSRARHKISV